MSPIIETATAQMSDLLREGKYRVPWHQRYYDWDAEVHVRDFLADIDEAAKHERECYFLGAVVLVEQSRGVWEINDGQQRFVTFSLACARLCRLFADYGNQADERLAMLPLFNIREWDQCGLSDAERLDPRLTPPKNDESNFNLLIRGRDVGSNGKMTAAWREIDDFFSNMSPDAATRFFRFMIKQLEVACLRVPLRLNPNAIFESLNARGKQLGDVDLLRNHIYSFFNAEAEAPRRDTVHGNIERAWDMLKSQTGGNVHAPVRVYARCFFQCKYGHLPEKRLYRATKAHIAECIGGSADGADYVYDLVAGFAHRVNIGIFRTITLPPRNEDFVDEFLRKSGTARSPRNLKHFLHEMRGYSVTQPILFALLCRYMSAPAEDKRSWGKFAHTCAGWLTSFVMRVALTGKFEPSVHEREFATCAQKIMSLSAPDTSDVVACLRERDEKMGVIDNRTFVEKVARVEMRTSSKAKNFLLPMERFEQRDLPMQMPGITVEHILPKSDKHLSGNGWASFDQSSHKECANLLGNLVLLRMNDNKPGQKDNASYARKRSVLARSALQLTRAVAEKHPGDWSPRTVASRQKYLAKLAAKVWKIALRENNR